MFPKKRRQQVIDFGMTFKTACETWLIEAGLAWKPATKRVYETTARRLIKIMGSRRIVEMTTHELEEYVEKMLEHAHSASAERQAVHVVKGTFRMMKRIGKIESNPAADMEINQQTRLPKRCLPVEDLASITPERMWAACEAVNKPSYTLWLKILAFTGMRPGEASALDYSDFEIQERDGKKVPIVRILRHYILGQLAPGRKKGDGSIRQVPMNIFMEVRSGGSSGRIFTFKEPDLTLITQRLRDALGLPIQVRELRKWYATYLRSQGAPMDFIQNQLGHSSPKTTEVYAQLTFKVDPFLDNRMSIRSAATQAALAELNNPMIPAPIQRETWNHPTFGPVEIVKDSMVGQNLLVRDDTKPAPAPKEAP